MGGNEDLFAEIDAEDQEERLTRRDYESARARNELAKAQLNEISVRVQSGRYVARAAVEQSAATLLATLAQTLRSIPDSLERKGISPDICVMVEAVVNDALDGAASDLELLANDPL
jgi:phage terminase Nu1 subunit (DNA packaging protein)